MHDADDDFAGEFSEEHTFFDRCIAGTDDHDGFVGVGSSVTGGAEGDAFVVKELVFAGSSGEAWFAAAGDDDALAFVVGAEGLDDLGVTFELDGADVS